MPKVTVQLPRLLSETLGVPHRFEVEAEDSHEAVEAMQRQHPALRGHLVDGPDGLRPNVLCALDGAATRLREPEPVRDGSTLVFTRSVAGG